MERVRGAVVRAETEDELFHALAALGSARRGHHSPGRAPPLRGIRGTPGGGLVVALIFVQAFNLPLEVAAIVGGIYRLVDMGNTTINVMGDMVGTSIVAHSEARRHGAGAATPRASR